MYLLGYHLVAVELVLVLGINCFNFPLELGDVVSLALLKLLQDFFLSCKLSLAILILCHCLIGHVLVLLVLSAEHLHLAGDCLHLDLSVLGGKQGVLVIALGLQQTLVGLCVLTLLLLKPLDPRLSGLLLGGQ